MSFADFDRRLARSLPGDFLKDVYPRAMRWFAEHGLGRGEGVVSTKYGFDMQVNRVDSIKWYLHYFGEFEPHISAAWTNFLPRSGVVLDIGANIGYHSLLAAQCVGPQGRVISFEPSGRIYRELCANVALNRASQISPQNVAVADQAGTVELHYAGENEQGGSSIVRGVGPSEAVRAISFADIGKLVDLSQVDLIKIDVEGAEPLVIGSLVPTVGMLKDQCAIFLEIGDEHDGEALIAPLLEAGFQVREIRNEYRTSFYRNPGKVALRPFRFEPGRLHDVVLCRDEAGFARMENGPA
ncbi:MAG TPA: FkbM family methyltransferase [Allosphingosinicella sp.]|nr:FkbM family methyltransferase [Allosphingosinicella sp.]